MSDTHTTPTPPIPSHSAPRHPLARSLKIIAQVLGFAVGIALLGWCIRIALQPHNRHALARLTDASAADVALLAGLSIVVLFASGAAFRETLVPIKRLSMLEVQATNIIACLLALLPFKLSVVFRVLIHNRRDGVPILTIGAWFSAVGVVILCVLLPMLGASVWRARADTLWFVAVIGGMLLMLVAVLLTARACSTPRGVAFLQSIYAKLPLPRSLRPGSPFTIAVFDKAHEGVRMLASPRVVFGCALLRVMDFAAQAGRIAVAAHILGVPLHWDHALLAGSAFFLIGAAAPSGALGVREAGTAKLIAYVLPGVDLDQFTLVVLTVTAMETVVMIAGSIPAAIYLRPYRLTRLGRNAKS